MKRVPFPRAVLPGLGLVLSGCFSYVPVELDAVLVGEQVRVHLSRAAMADMLLAADDSADPRVEPVVSGTLSGREQGFVLVRVPITVEREGFLRAPFGQDVRIPAGEILAAERRRLHGSRTALTGAGAAAFAAFVIYAIMDGALGGESPQPDGGENIRRLLGLGSHALIEGGTRTVGGRRW